MSSLLRNLIWYRFRTAISIFIELHDIEAQKRKRRWRGSVRLLFGNQTELGVRLTPPKKNKKNNNKQLSECKYQYRKCP
jgi:hypothetical protein